MADVSHYIPYPLLPVVASATTEILKLCRNCQIMLPRCTIDALVMSLDVQIVCFHCKLASGFVSWATGEVKLCVLSVKSCLR